MIAVVRARHHHWVLCIRIQGLDVVQIPQANEEACLAVHHHSSSCLPRTFIANKLKPTRCSWLLIHLLLGNSQCRLAGDVFCRWFAVISLDDLNSRDVDLGNHRNCHRCAPAWRKKDMFGHQSGFLATMDLLHSSPKIIAMPGAGPAGHCQASSICRSFSSSAASCQFAKILFAVKACRHFAYAETGRVLNLPELALEEHSVYLADHFAQNNGPTGMPLKFKFELWDAAFHQMQNCLLAHLL